MTVLKKNYAAPEFNKKEICRYAFCEPDKGNLSGFIDACIKECEDAFTYNVCWCEFPVKITNCEIELQHLKIKSASLIKNLEGCSKAVVFGATVGIEIDRIISKYSRIAPAKAVVFQAIGAQRIEALCDAFNNEITQNYLKHNLYTKPRFSPGYGDFNLEYQKDIFRFLDLSKQIGISLNESLLMSPSKSVTGIIGISDKKEKCNSLCEICSKADCVFRR